MANDSSGNTATGVVLGAILVGLVVIGFFAYQGGDADQVDVRIDQPTAPAPERGQTPSEPSGGGQGGGDGGGQQNQ